MAVPHEIYEDMRKLELQVVTRGELQGQLNVIDVHPTLFKEIKDQQTHAEL